MLEKEISKKRRNLILASAATPVIATLRSGAAIAASSGAVCRPIDGQVSNKKFKKNGNSINGDTAVRYAVPTKKKLGGAKGSKYIYDIDGAWYRQSGKVYYGDFSEYEDHEDAYVLMLYQTDSEGTYELGLWPKVQFDHYVPSDPFPINVSCLTSIAASGDYSFRGL